MDIETILEMYEDDYNPGPRIGFNKGGEAEFQRKLQLAYDKYGKDALDKGAKALGFKNYASMSGEENNNFRKKIKNEIIKYGEVLPKYEADVRGRRTRIPKEQGIQIKLLEATNKNEFFDPKKFAKENNISIKQLKAEAVKLRNNIYDKRMLVAGKKMRSTLTWIPDDLQVADNALTKMWKSKLIVDDRGKIENLFYDAFKNGSISSKKYLAIRDNLTEYYQLNEAIKKKYPSLAFELDHPLSKSSLKNLFDAKPEQLIFVNPLNKDLNRGFKDSLSQQYEKAMGDPKKGIKPNLNKKKAVEKIARDLKLNIGKISDDATNFKYGVKEFQKLNIKDEILKAVQNQADLSSNFKNYVKNNPDLFKEAGVNPNVNINKITQSEVKGIKKLIQDLQKVTSKGGSKGKAATKALQIIAAGGIGFNMEDILKGTGLMDKEYELTASAVDAPIVEKGLSTGEKIAAGTTGALGVGTKTGRKLLGRALNLGFGPTGILGINAYLGIDPKSSVDRSIAATEAALLPQAVKGVTSVTDTIKNPLIRKTVERATLAGMSPAMALKLARVANPVGIATLAGEAIYNVGKLGYEDQQRFDALSPEEQAAERAEQEKFAFDITGA
jgi:hypothetical protein